MEFFSAGAQEKVIREGIVRDDLIEAIIGLPPKLFYNVGIPACVIVINKNQAGTYERQDFVHQCR